MVKFDYFAALGPSMTINERSKTTGVGCTETVTPTVTMRDHLQVATNY